MIHCDIVKFWQCQDLEGFKRATVAFLPCSADQNSYHMTALHVFICEWFLETYQTFYPEFYLLKKLNLQETSMPIERLGPTCVWADEENPLANRQNHPQHFSYVHSSS